MKKLVIEERQIPTGARQRGLDGLRIVQVTDIHLSGRPGRLLRRAAEEVARLEPDILVFTGDAVNRREAWPEAARWLRDLPATVARLAVPGNWDFRRGGLPAFQEAMAAAGFRVLLNQRVRIDFRDTCVEAIGFDDVREGAPEIPSGAEEGKRDHFVLALCHSPDVLLDLHPSRFDLLLCGHTHGGQVRLPGYGAVFTRTLIGKRYEGGFYEPLPGHYVHVSRGLGEGPIKIRFLCPPELARFTLRPIVS